MVLGLLQSLPRFQAGDNALAFEFEFVLVLVFRA